jgi:hypothetical protein
MINHISKLLFLSSDLDDALRLLKGRITITNRFFLVKNKIKIFIAKDYTSCVFKYKNDPVPLFVFNDKDSVSALVIALKMED